MSQTALPRPPFSGLADSLAMVAATISGNLALLVFTIVCGTLAFLFARVPPRGKWFRVSADAWSWLVMSCGGVRLKKRFEAQLDPDRRYVFMANHQSLFDIMVLFRSLPVPFRFLAKRSLFRIPILGWALRAAGFVSVDREHRDKGRQAFSSALEALRAGDSLMVFPEETRSLDGRLKEFRRGGFLMALKTGLAVVPVGIHGTLRARRKGSLKIRPGRVEVAIGRPIEVTEYGLKRKEELMAVVASEIGRLARIDAAEPAVTDDSTGDSIAPSLG